ncbi:hypothetical protein KSF_001140 [Reticulibacter mediterranei]|uniref:Uncharacterized protein n=1 Tax=Reticulibacter mediterranei TaxID=2778369 RepID=A0A8J3II63_9CHLR|nr:hypothetical protein [Reticulibacter mediterranei]GHO90066.1 hypothetical protein KSF_001140 [Reticulibacter mediterranei]
MHLSTVDRFVCTLGPVNALVEYLCERLLPNAVAHTMECIPGRFFVIQVGGVAFGLALLMLGIALGTVVNESFFSVAARSRRITILNACQTGWMARVR